MAVLTAGCQGAASAGPSALEDDEPKLPGAPQAGGSTSDFGGSTIPCPCAALQFYAERLVVVRVTVEAQTGDDRYSLRVRELLFGTLSLGPGETFEAIWDGRSPCYAGCPEVSVGDDAIAFYQVEPQACPERERCIADCVEDAENAADDGQLWGMRSECSETYVLRGYEHECESKCEPGTADACPDQPEPDHRRGSVRLAPWTDPLVFASTDLGELSVPLADLDELWPAEGEFTPEQIGACVERFGDWSDLLEHAP